MKFSQDIWNRLKGDMLQKKGLLKAITTKRQFRALIL